MIAVTKLVDQVLRESIDRSAILERLPEQRGDVRQTFADTTLAERDLGYRRSVDIEAGIDRFASWYLEERAAGRLA